MGACIWFPSCGSSGRLSICRRCSSGIYHCSHSILSVCCGRMAGSTNYSFWSSSFRTRQCRCICSVDASEHGSDSSVRAAFRMSCCYWQYRGVSDLNEDVYRSFSCSHQCILHAPCYWISSSQSSRACVCLISGFLLRNCCRLTLMLDKIWSSVLQAPHSYQTSAIPHPWARSLTSCTPTRCIPSNGPSDLWRDISDSCIPFSDSVLKVCHVFRRRSGSQSGSASTR